MIKVFPTKVMPWALGSGVVGLMMLAAAPADANIMLFTTTSDFTHWTNPTVASASTAYDYDGVTINGAGNNPGNMGSSINVGGSSTGGSLQFNEPSTSSLGYSVLSVSPGEAYNNAFMSAIDPGSTTAYTAPNYTAGSTVAYSGNLLLTYTVPTTSTVGGYYQIGVNLAYPASGYYAPFFGASVSDGTVGGLSTYTTTIPYTIKAGAGNLTSFTLGIQSNSNQMPTSPFYVDSIQVIPSAVPEPVSALSLGSIAVCGLLSRRRKLV